MFLWFIATGDTYRLLFTRFGYSIPKIGRLIKSLAILISKNPSQYITHNLLPDSVVTQKWLFDRSYNQPDCMAAMDGVFVQINRPRRHGKSYYSGRKKAYGLCMLAAVYFNSKFIYVNVGNSARMGASLIFQCSSFKTAIENGNSSISENNEILVDSSFSPAPYLVKSTERIGSGSARVLVEHVFGQFKQQFRLFLNRSSLHPKQHTRVLYASAIIFNIMKKVNSK